MVRDRVWDLLPSLGRAWSFIVTSDKTRANPGFSYRPLGRITAVKLVRMSTVKRGRTLGFINNYGENSGEPWAQLISTLISRANPEFR